jgi:hypothetical protein
MAMKFILVIAAVLAGDPATTDPSLEVIPMFFEGLASCETEKAKSTGKGKGEIDGKKVLRIVGRCQELSPNGMEQLKNTLGR